MNICEAVDMAIFSPKGRVLVSNIFLFFFFLPRKQFDEHIFADGWEKPPSSDEIARISF